MERLAVAPADGSTGPTPGKAAADLDRGVSAPRFSEDGSAITFFVTDDRSVYPARVRLSGGPVERLMQPPIMMNGANDKGGCSVVLSSSDSRPNEVFAFENGKLRQLTHQNDAVFSELQLGA